MLQETLTNISGLRIMNAIKHSYGPFKGTVSNLSSFANFFHFVNLNHMPSHPNPSFKDMSANASPAKLNVHNDSLTEGVSN